MAFLLPFSVKSHCRLRVDNRRVLSGIIGTKKSVALGNFRWDRTFTGDHVNVRVWVDSVEKLALAMAVEY